MLVQNPSSRISLQNILLIIGSRWQFIEPLLGDADLALGGASVDLLEAVGGRVDETAVGQSLEESLTGEAHDLPLFTVKVDSEQLNYSVGDFGGGGSGSSGGGGGADEDGFGERSERWEAVELGGESLERRYRHFCRRSEEWGRTVG